MDIIGVDFSGAKSDRNTWVATAVLDSTTLRLDSSRPVTRDELATLLSETAGPTVAALDFPFSVPESFARFWQPQAAAMPDLWKAAACIDLDGFLAVRDGFVAAHGEPKRLADTFHPECYSCLHKVNPNMVPMTFRGMQMLHRLWPSGCEVPPLPREESGIRPDAPLLLEAMPGAALKALGLPYKGYKTGRRTTELRHRILDGLERLAVPQLSGLEAFREVCLDNHDCLDAVVASLVAAMWVLDRGLFRCPAEPGQPAYDPVVILEGWLYAPVFYQEQSGQPPAPSC